MSFEQAFLLTFVVIPVSLGALSHLWGWATEYRFWKHRKTQGDYLRDYLRNL